MARLTNKELNSLANTKYSDEFLNMMRKWYKPGLLKGKDLEDLLIKNISPDNVHGIMYEYISRYIPINGKSILEIGCGSGQNIETWFRAGAGKLTALDIDETPVVITKQRCKELQIKNVNIIQADFLSYEFDEEFDIVNCVQVIEHVGRENQLNAILKTLKLTKLNGIVFIQIPNKSCIIDTHDSQLPFAHWLPRRVGTAYARLFNRTPPTWDPMPYGRVKRILENSGGKILNKIDMCNGVKEFLDYRLNKRRSIKNVIFSGVVLLLYPLLRGNINAILPNINLIVRKVT